ncbi:MAG: helicase, superfamily [Firmicutes bacterium]|nr:helicase, superfamily [Bacillota bacterium]
MSRIIYDNSNSTKEILNRVIIKLSKKEDTPFISDAVGTDYLYKWTPATPVFLSAQTGRGKNTFVEQTIIGKLAKNKHSVLILSNRIALSRQEKYRIAEIMDNIEQREQNTYEKEIKELSNAPAVLDRYEDFGVVTIKSYQSFLSSPENLKEYYDFIILDECHFFLADAEFNKYTFNILEGILTKYPYAIRIYLTATPNEVIAPIIKKEEEYRLSCRFDGREFYPIFLKRKVDRSFSFNSEGNYVLVNETLSEQEPIESMQSYNGDQHNTYETFNKFSAVIYELEREYSQIDCKYLKLYKELTSNVNKESTEKEKVLNQYRPLLELINEQIKKENINSKRKEKWLIFVQSKSDGKYIQEDLGKEVADYIDASLKDSEVYRKICEKGKFDKKVLVTTSVLDNGVNIFDKDVKHVAIFVFDKVSFLQMLGRKRLEENQNITLYIQEYSEQILKDNLKRAIKLQKYLKLGNSKPMEIAKQIFNRDEVFFYIGSLKDINIGYNRFLVDKLSCEISFFKKILKQNDMDHTQDEDYFYSDDKDITYDQYVQEKWDKENSIDISGVEDTAQRTIIEQLSWIYKEGSFDLNNYLVASRSEEDEKNIERNIKELIDFLEANVENDEIPVSGSDLTNFYRTRGMNSKKREEFRKKLTELLIKTYGLRAEDDRENNKYGKDVIEKCFKAHELPYAIFEKGVKVTKKEKEKYGITDDSQTFWILKNVERQNE